MFLVVHMQKKVREYPVTFEEQNLGSEAPLSERLRGGGARTAQRTFTCGVRGGRTDVYLLAMLPPPPLAIPSPTQEW